MTPAFLCLGIPALLLAMAVANWPAILKGMRRIWRGDRDTDL